MTTPASGDHAAEAAHASEPAATEDEQKAKFREALAKKHGESGAQSSSHHPGSSAVPSSNDKRMRQFRRKSGG